MLDNREEIKSLPLIWQNLLRQRDMAFECVIPAVVVSYDRPKNLVTVCPAINRVMAANGESIPRAEVIVPCFNPAGGGIGINFPLKAGNTGWLIAADRDTSGFKSTRKVSTPESHDLHRFAFGFFLPDEVYGFAISPLDDGALVIQTTDGTTKISIKDDDIQISTMGKSTVTASEVEVSALTVSLTAATSLSVVAPAITVTGEIALTGGMAASADVTASGVSLKTHVHYDPSEEDIITGRPVS